MIILKVKSERYIYGYSELGESILFLLYSDDCGEWLNFEIV